MKLPQAFFLFLLLAVQVDTIWAQGIEDLKWLAQDWTLEKDGKIISESWSYMNDSTLVGSSTTTKNDSILFEEALKIENRNGIIRYIALLPTDIVTFELEQIKTDRFSFVNKKNDFPSKIHYRQDGELLEITLTGKGKRSVMQFSKIKSR